MKSLVEKFSNHRVAVLGDLMLDKYLMGDVERISPEAPIPIVRVTKDRIVPGGAANTAANLVAMGAKVSVFGFIGNDSSGKQLTNALSQLGVESQGCIYPPDYPTIEKVRVIGHNQQLLRIDFEALDELRSRYTEYSLQFLKDLESQSIDAIVVSDYQKFVVNAPLMEGVKAIAKKRGLPIVVDPRPEHADFYCDVQLITPNRKEAEAMSGLKIRTDEEAAIAGQKLREKLRTDVVITRGDKGMSVFENGSAPVHLSTEAKEVFDVSGAGDTVVAVLSLAILSGAPLKQASEIANIAAGIKVSKFGTAVVKRSELLERIS